MAIEDEDDGEKYVKSSGDNWSSNLGCMVIVVVALVLFFLGGPIGTLIESLAKGC